MRSKAWYISLIISCIAFSAQAQFPSRDGRFTVDQVKGCVPFTVTITINPDPNCYQNKPCTCDSSTPCQMTFGDNTPGKILVFTYTYTTAGTYTLEVLFQTTGADVIQITATADTPPQFDLYTCGGNQVSVNITDTNYNQYVIDYNDGKPLVVVPVGNLAKDNHAYNSSGNQLVTVRGRNTGALDNCTPASKNVTTMLTLPAPVITQLQVIDNTSIQLNYTAQPNILYRLEIASNNATSFQLLKTSYNITSETLTNVKPDDNYYCFRLGAFDPCNNTTVYSNVICSANMDVSVQNNSNNVTWTTSTAGATNLRLSRSSAGSTITTTVTSSPYADTNIVCGTNYCYQLTTNYPNGSTSTSLQKCGTAISTDIPGAVQNITAIVGQTGLDLQWQQVVGYTPSEFSVFKSGENFYDLLGKTAALQMNDPAYVTESGACYKISYLDVCGNQSPLGAEACPVRVDGNLLNDNSVNLTWTPYSGWQQGVSSYTVEKYSEQGQLLQTFNAGAALNFVDDSQDLNNQIYIYLIKANASEAGLPQAVSNRIVIIKDPNLFYPTAFTPNGDNLNDIFNVFGQYIVTFEMNIFNRWGELVYTTGELEQGWDGYYKGNLMPEGTYTFIAEITDRAGRTIKKSGSVLLLKKGK